MLDVVPAVVIMISAVVAGLSADLDDEHSNIVWEADPKFCDQLQKCRTVLLYGVRRKRRVSSRSRCRWRYM